MSNTSSATKPDQTEFKGVKIGVVDSDARDQTRRVEIAYLAPHPKYGKYVSRRTLLHVHDENNESKAGDKVEIVQCRPVSKTKKWRLLRVVERASDID